MEMGWAPCRIEFLTTFDIDDEETA